MSAEPLLVPAATVHAPNAMVATVDSLATQAGLAVLEAGGSAADAAIGANAVLAVTAPNLCGMGGDLFALVHDGAGPPHVLVAAGRAGSGADPDRLRAEGHDAMPFRLDPRSVTVPGCVDGWLALHARFGRLPLEQVLARAVDYAGTGFPASPLLVGSARSLPAPLPVGAESYRDLDRPGQRVVRPGAARALQAIAGQGRDGFYGGEFGEGLLALGQGEYTPDDLARPLAEWVAPLGLRVWDHDLWTVPPPSQGYLTLAGAWLAERDGLLDDPDDGSWAVALVAAAMAAGSDRPEVLWDGADGVELLAPSRLARLGSASEAIGRGRSGPTRPAAGDGRHHLPVHRRRAGHGRVAHPVERGRVRQPPLRAGDRDQPPQPRHRVLTGARPPRGVRAGSPPAAHALARTGDPSRR